MTQQAGDITATNFRLLLRQALVPLEIARYRLVPQSLDDLPRGDGHAVMLVPGFGFDDEILAPLMRAIEAFGYAVYGWDQGRNLGMRPRIRERLSSRLQELNHRHRSKVSLIGWSLGGVFVRELARAQPDRVRRVITLGSPLNGYEVADDLLTQMTGMIRAKLLSRTQRGPLHSSPAPNVPCTAIYSRSDGFVDWRAAMEAPAANTDNVEVRASHLGLLYNPDVLRAIAERLARKPRSVPRPTS